MGGKRDKPQNTVTEIVACRNCGGAKWKMYKRRGSLRYYVCMCCGQHRVDKIIVKLRLIRH